MERRHRQGGYSLFELVVAIVILGIIASVAIRTLTVTGEIARVEQTKRELDQLAWAIAGRPDLVSGGHRTDFGYVGDVGSLPGNLGALVTNPGYATWRGPYIRDDYYLSEAAGEIEFGIDAWGAAYSYSGGTRIVSTGSGSDITREIANRPDDLLGNTVSVAVTDLDNTPPGSVYRDSVQILLTVPDGAGLMTAKTRTPTDDGFARFDSVSIGNHLLRIVYIPTGDTLRRRVIVDPGEDRHVTANLAENVW